AHETQKIRRRTAAVEKVPNVPRNKSIRRFFKEKHQHSLGLNKERLSQNYRTTFKDKCCILFLSYVAL
ncbi:hypothetical protein, partial [Pyramidobacter sp.]|uniref:hypothetical protein n=1 Tax=Pyramidobacter sp. TaxID=1943581 RepID=UPI0025D93589